MTYWGCSCHHSSFVVIVEFLDIFVLASVCVCCWCCVIDDVVVIFVAVFDHFLQKIDETWTHGSEFGQTFVPIHVCTDFFESSAFQVQMKIACRAHICIQNAPKMHSDMCTCSYVLWSKSYNTYKFHCSLCSMMPLYVASSISSTRLGNSCWLIFVAQESSKNLWSNTCWKSCCSSYLSSFLASLGPCPWQVITGF